MSRVRASVNFSKEPPDPDPRVKEILLEVDAEVIDAKKQSKNYDGNVNVMEDDDNASDDDNAYDDDADNMNDDDVKHLVTYSLVQCLVGGAKVACPPISASSSLSGAATASSSPPVSAPPTSPWPPRPSVWSATLELSPETNPRLSATSTRR